MYLTGGPLTERYEVTALPARLGVRKKDLWIVVESSRYTKTYGDEEPVVKWLLAEDRDGAKPLPLEGGDYLVTGGFLRNDLGRREPAGDRRIPDDFACSNPNYTLRFTRTPYLTVNPYVLNTVIPSYERSSLEEDPVFAVDTTQATLLFEDDAPVVSPEIPWTYDMRPPGIYLIPLNNSDTGNPNYRWDTSAYGTLRIWNDNVLCLTNQVERAYVSPLYNDVRDHFEMTFTDCYAAAPYTLPFRADGAITIDLETAVKYTRPGGRVLIPCGPNDVKVTASSNSVTIDRNITIQRVFLPGYNEATAGKAILKDNLRIADGVVCNLVDINLDGAIELQGETSALVMKRTTVRNTYPVTCSGNFGAIDLSDGCVLGPCLVGLRLQAPDGAPPVNGIVSIRDTAFAFQYINDTQNRFITCRNNYLQSENGVIWLEGCTFNGAPIADDFSGLQSYFGDSTEFDETDILFQAR